MFTDFIDKIRHATEYIDSPDPIQVDIYSAIYELRALGYTVNHTPAPCDENWLLEVYDGDDELVAKKGVSEIMTLDVLTQLRRIAEGKNVMNRLDGLRQRMANVGWNPCPPRDGRIQIDKPSGRSRTYDLTYVHLAEIEGELAHAEFCKFVLPRAYKLGRAVRAECHMASCRWTLLRTELYAFSSELMESLAEISLAIPVYDCTEECADVDSTSADPASEVEPITGMEGANVDPASADPPEA